jgi:16S rRNA (guanine1207-N2)-methyltransferase
MKSNQFNYVVLDKEMMFSTHLDLFSPLGADLGTLSMLSKVSLKGNEKVLDLGCGYGFVGIYLKTIYPDIEIHMVDNDPLAIEYARKNIKSNNFDLKVWLSNGMIDVEDNDYDLILSNPPYHEDFSVPKNFIEKGFLKLNIGGSMIMVVKRLLWYKNKLTSIFGGVQVNEIDGYFVLISEKRSAKQPDKQEKPIKKKHKKRINRSKRR